MTMDEERRTASPDRRQRRGRRIADLETHDQRHVTMRQVMDYFQVSRRTVVKWIDDAGLVGYRYDGGWRFKLTDLQTFASRHRIEKGVQTTSNTR